MADAEILFQHRGQPAKALVLSACRASLLVKLPFWTISLIPRSRRPRPSCSLKKCIFAKASRHITNPLDQVGITENVPDYTAISTAPDARGVWIEPNPSLIQGQVKYWAHSANVEPIRIPGYWYHSSSAPSNLKVGMPARSDEKVFYILHGGGYISGSAYLSGPSLRLYSGILESTESVHRSFAVEYRLSSTSPLPTSNPFPAALLDAITGYNHLINVVGFLPENIIIVGDSSGGHLGLSLIRYLVESGVLPVPGGFIALSTTCDISTSHLFIPNSSLLSCGDTDVIGLLNEGILGWGLRAYAGSLHNSADAGPELNPYFSPASLHPTMEDAISFKGFSRTFLCYGGAERLRDPNRTLSRRMTRDLGGEMVTTLEAPDAIHNYVATKWHEPERTQALAAISKWVDNSIHDKL